MAPTWGMKNGPLAKLREWDHIDVQDTARDWDWATEIKLVLVPGSDLMKLRAEKYSIL